MPGFYVEEFEGPPDIESMCAALRDWRPVGRKFDAVDFLCALDHSSTRPEDRTLRAAWRGLFPGPTPKKTGSVCCFLREYFDGGNIEGATLTEPSPGLFEWVRA
jgi:hypothetical protein